MKRFNFGLLTMLVLLIAVLSGSVEAAVFDNAPLSQTSGTVSGSTPTAGSWSISSAHYGADWLFSTDGNAYPASTNGGYSGDILNGTPAGPQYDSTGVLKFYSTAPTGGNAVVGISVHNVNSSGVADTTGGNFYFAGYSYNSGTPSLSGWFIYKYYAGSGGPIGTNTALLYTTAAAATGGTDPVTAATLPTGEYGLKLTWRTGGVLTLYVNGTQVATATDTQSILQNAGYVGIIQHPTSGTPVNGATSGMHLRNIQATDYVSNGFNSVTPSAVPTGHSGAMTINLVAAGSTTWSTGTVFSVTNAASTAGLSTATIVSSTATVTDSTHVSIQVTTSAGTANSFTISDGTNTSPSIPIAVPVMTTSPVAIAATGGAQTVTFTETVNGSASNSRLTNEQLTSTNTSVATIGTTSAWVNGVATATVTPVAAGTTTFTNTSDPAVASFTVTASFPFYGSSNYRLSPYNWVNDTTNSVVYTSNQGAYIHTTVTTTGAGNVTLTYDGTNTTGSTSNILMWQFTGTGIPTASALNYAQLGGTTTNSTVTLYTGLPAGTYDLFIQVASLSYFSGLTKWTSTGTRPASSFCPTSLTLAGGGSLAAPASKPLNIMVLGDSISLGANNTVPGQEASKLYQYDASIAYGNVLAHALNAEVGIRAFGGSGMACTSGESVPQWWTSASYDVPTNAQPWNAYNSTTSMLTSGKFSPVPDVIFTCLNTNDVLTGKTSAAVQANYFGGTTGLLLSLRNASSASTKIVLLPTPGDDFTSANTAALAAYNAAYPADTNVYAPTYTGTGCEKLIGLNGTSTSGPSGLYTLDSVHPNRLGQTALGGIYALMYGKVTGGATVTNIFTRGSYAAKRGR